MHFWGRWGRGLYLVLERSEVCSQRARFLGDELFFPNDQSELFLFLHLKEMLCSLLHIIEEEEWDENQTISWVVEMYQNRNCNQSQKNPLSTKELVKMKRNYFNLPAPYS